MVWGSGQHLRAGPQVYGPGLEAVQLPEAPHGREVGDEVEHVVLLLGCARLLRQEAVGGRKAVVRLADQLAVPQAFPCAQT